MGASLSGFMRFKRVFVQRAVYDPPFDSDAIRSTPRTLPSPSTSRCGSISFDILCRHLCRKLMIARWASRTCGIRESATARTCFEEWRNRGLKRPLYKGGHSSCNLRPVAQDCRAPTTVAVGVCKVVKSAVKEIVSEVDAARFAYTNVLALSYQRRSTNRSHWLP